jgi:hypothetical protein
MIRSQRSSCVADSGTALLEPHFAYPSGTSQQDALCMQPYKHKGTNKRAKGTVVVGVTLSAHHTVPAHGVRTQEHGHQFSVSHQVAISAALHHRFEILVWLWPTPAMAKK